MQNQHVRQVPCLILGLALLCTMPSEALAEPIFLDCRSGSFQYSLALDYTDGTIEILNFADGNKFTDENGHSILPINVGDNAVKWRTGYRAAGGLIVRVYWTLNRLTGILTAYNDSTRDGNEPMACIRASKPQAKF